MITTNDLPATPGNGICEVVYIGILNGKIQDVIQFIRDQINGGHRATLVNSLGESLISKIEKL